MTRTRLTLLSIVLPCLALGGCGSGATLDVGYPDDATRRAVATAGPRRILVGRVADQRADATRIGSWPKDDGAIVTSRPVTDIVRDALTTELTKRGHQVVTGNPDLILTADVEAFWLDTMRAHPSRQYLGRVVVLVTLTDAHSRSTPLSRRFIGIKRTLADGTSERASQDVMNAALARAMHDLATDPELAAAFRG